MEIYRLTPRGEQLAHSFRSPHTPEWGVVHFLGRRGAATSDNIMEYVPDATASTLMKLRLKGIITGTSGGE